MNAPQPDAAAQAEAWFDARGWTPFAFQREAWAAALAGESGLVHASTGTGKTYAVWLGALLRALAGGVRGTPPLTVLWVTPLRALAADTARALAAPLAALAPGWTLQTRTADISSAARARQRRRLPSVLVTTPESLSLLLSYPDAAERFAGLATVVVDEWHELLGSKRGVQVELALARLRRWNPRLATWGLSATLGNLEQALDALLGADAPRGRLIRGELPRRVELESLIPADMERFPWAGHLGLRLLPQVVERIAQGGSTLLFTNTRSQTETWYQAILAARPDWAGELALHHGSLDREQRAWVERALGAGLLRCVVCTSSLDLGVDFAPVDRVIQVGSPRGVARLLQRAGRSGHCPGGASRVLCVPTHAFELAEFAAARRALGQGAVEAREPLEAPLDVLCQHLVTVAAGGGFRPRELLDEVRGTHAYRALDEAAWAWALDFVSRGGALSAYPEYRRVVERDGVWRVEERSVATRHRLNIGTIAADAAVEVRYLSGGRLGTVEESFAGRLRPGERFLFAGRTLECLRLREMTLWVRRAAGSAGAVPRWMGGSLPLSSRLADAVLELLGGPDGSAEADALAPILALQARLSGLPRPGALLLERLESREGHHLFCYPFAGRAVHEGLAALLAWRLARRAPATYGIAVNDYGFELLSAAPVPLEQALADGLLDPAGLDAELPQAVNTAELSKREFREVARVAGLVVQSWPGMKKSARQLQASSELLYDVLDRHDPGNLLLAQAREQALGGLLQRERLRATLARLAGARLHLAHPPQATPLAVPLMVERLRARLSSEKLAQRVARMQLMLERGARRLEGR